MVCIANDRHWLSPRLFTSQTLTEHLQCAGSCLGPWDTSHRNPCPGRGRPRINPINMVDVRVISTREKRNAGKKEGEHQ